MNTTSVTVTVHGRCQLCGARVLWSISATSGRPMPLDPAPDAELGNIVLDRRNGVQLIAVVLGRDQAAARRAHGERLYVHHRVSCAYG